MEKESLTTKKEEVFKVMSDRIDTIIEDLNEIDKYLPSGYLEKAIENLNEFIDVDIKDLTE